MGDYTDLVCTGRIFSQTSLQLEIKCNIFFFSALHVMSDIFSVQDTFLRGIHLHPFIQSTGHFFSEITRNPLKSQMVGP